MFAIILFLSLLPSFAWLFFYLREDLHPEPKRLILLTFTLGGASTFVALIFQTAISCIVFKDCPGDSQSIDIVDLSLIGLILFAGIEEIVKFVAAYFAVHKRAAFNEPVDAMIYMVVAGLGFATVENFAIADGLNPANTLHVAHTVEALAFRFIGATLLHSLASGLIGYYWAISIREFKKKTPLVFGILIATILHSAFNYLIIISDISYGIGQIGYAIILVAIAGFFILEDFEKLRRKAI